MKTIINFCAAFALAAAAAKAQLLGIYASIDEEGKRTALWEISEQNGELVGKILRLEGYADDTICDKCERRYKGFTHAADASKMKLVGAPLLYALRAKGGGRYEGGYIIDPKTGKQYRANAELAGDELVLRGYIGFALIGRTQVWKKVNE